MTQLLAFGGTAAIGAAVVLIGALHVLAPELDPSITMISAYALGEHRTLFDAGMLFVVAGSVAILAALVRSGATAPSSVAAVLLGTWCVAMLAVVVFPTCDCRMQVTVTGAVHAAASMIGFLCLPVAALCLARTSRHRAGLRVLAAVSLVLLVPMFFALVPVAAVAQTDLTAVPFGLIERALALVDVALLVLLARAPSRAASIVTGGVGTGGSG